MAETATSLILRARRRADMERSAFISNAEALKEVNSAWYELYELMVKTFEDYFVLSHDISVVAGTEEYDLSSGGSAIAAPGLFKLRGVDYEISSDQRVSLKPFSWSERDKYLSTTPFGRRRRGSGEGMRYCLQGSKIRFAPIPDIAATIKVWYVPKPSELVESAAGAGQRIDLPAEVQPRWEEYVVLEAAIQFLLKEQNDTQMLELRKAKLKEEIEGSMVARDADEPARMVRRDTYDEYEP